MKKIILVWIVMIVLLAGCGNNTGSETTKSGDDSTKATQTSIKENNPTGYVFEVNGVTIAMNAEVAPILEKLGKEMDFFEAESCAFQGMERIYTYSGFELHTYEKDKVDYVAAIIFQDDSVSTKEGIYLFSDLDDVIKTYGDNYTQDTSLYTYELDKSKLKFLIEDNKVASIEYLAIME